MNLSQISAIATGVIIALFFLLFAVSSIREHKSRAAYISLGLILVVIMLLLSSILWWRLSDSLLMVGTAAVWLFGLLYFLPLSKPTSLVTGAIIERVDERDTMFAREEYRPGTRKYEQYYAEHPQYKDMDDRLRHLPVLFEPGGCCYEPDRAQRIKAAIQTIQSHVTQVDGEVSNHKISRDPTTMTAEIKKLVLRMGAAEVGVARLNPMFVYSHVGRGPEPWGKPIELNNEFAVMFTLEMDYDQVEQAPDLPTSEETVLQYQRAATISISLARYIRSLGYPARAHISDSNYQIMLPPVAHDAGLGELSRMGYLMSRKFGARFRLGGVTTDIPLVPDKPVTFGVQDFCAVCSKCADNCPAAAIPHGDKTLVRGVSKWQLNVELCLWYWRVAGTDCGLCMKVCPYSHPPTLVHNIIRAQIKHSAFAQRVSVWGDDLLYGRRICKK